MKVSHLTGPLGKRGGGISSTVLPLGRALANLGCDVSLYGSINSPRDLGDWRPLDVCTQPNGVLNRFVRYREVAGRVLRSDADLVHVHGLWSASSLVSNRCRSKGRIPHLVTPHGMLNRSALGVSKWKKRVALTLFERKQLDTASCIHALSHGELDEIRKFGIKKPICVLPNGFDAESMSPMKKVPDWKGLRDVDEKTMIYLGRIHPIKGLETFIRSWSRASDAMRSERWKLVVAGWDDADHLGELKTLVNRLNLGAEILFIGPQYESDKFDCLRSAEMFVLPSTSEGFPVSVLEAWACKLPVLITPSCNLPLAFRESAAIELPENEIEAARTLETVASMDSGVLRNIGANGYRLLQDCFQWRQIASEMLAVYEWIVRGSSIPDCVDIYKGS